MLSFEVLDNDSLFPLSPGVSSFHWSLRLVQNSVRLQPFSWKTPLWDSWTNLDHNLLLFFRRKEVFLARTWPKITGFCRRAIKKKDLTNITMGICVINKEGRRFWRLRWHWCWCWGNSDSWADQICCTSLCTDAGGYLSGVPKRTKILRVCTESTYANGFWQTLPKSSEAGVKKIKAHKLQFIVGLVYKLIYFSLCACVWNEFALGTCCLHLIAFKTCILG